jgi:hypothetical protein
MNAAWKRGLLRACVAVPIACVVIYLAYRLYLLNQTFEAECSTTNSLNCGIAGTLFWIVRLVGMLFVFVVAWEICRGLARWVWRAIAPLPE